MKRICVSVLAVLLIVAASSCRKKKKEVLPGNLDTFGCTKGLEVIRQARNEVYVVHISLPTYAEMISLDDHTTGNIDTSFRCCNLPDNLNQKGNRIRLSGTVTKAPLYSSRYPEAYIKISGAVKE